MKAAVVGAAGYSGEELVRLLLGHPQVTLAAVTSRALAGKNLAASFPRFAASPKARALSFTAPDPRRLADQADVIFLALPHGVAAEFAEPLLAAGKRVIDLSADFRLKSPEIYQEFYGHPHPAPALLERSVYGLSELYRSEIKNGALIACPGCYPTSILLPLLPLLRAGLIDPAEIIADCKSGVSGAGRKTAEEFLFVECNESVRAYGTPKHRHLSEIEQELTKVANRPMVVQFTPHLIPMNRGIFTTLYLRPARELSEPAFARAVGETMRAAYGAEPFVSLLGEEQLPDTKHVVGTNLAEISWKTDPRTGRLLMFSCLDNLLKGASGQAIQNFNIACGFPETTGL